MIELAVAPPFVTVQDLGRTGHRAAGVPPGGAMDRFALSVANVLVGNAPGAAAFEWVLGAGALRFSAPGLVALAGAEVDACLDNAPVPGETTLPVHQGSLLEIRRFARGRFLYIGFAGGIAVPEVLGSRSTYLPGGFGGHHGRLLHQGDQLTTGVPPHAAPPPGFAMPALLRPAEDQPIHVLGGPQRHRFSEDAWARFTGESWRVAASSDRIGYRLEGTALDGAERGLLPSEPTCAGTVQVPSDGHPIVLQADAPTIGGYPQLATVIGPDLGRLAQALPGECVRFAEVTIERAQQQHRRRAVDLHTLTRLAATAARH